MKSLVTSMDQLAAMGRDISEVAVVTNKEDLDLLDP